MKSRKLVKLGKSSLVVSLPKKWVEELGLKPGDEVSFKKEFDGSLRVIPKEKKVSPLLKELEIDVERCNNEKLLNLILKSSYLTGKEKIIITNKKGLKGWQLDSIRKIMEEIRGLEIEEQNIDRVVLRTFIDSTKINTLSYFKRKVSLITSMIDYLINGVMEKRKDLLEEMDFLYKELNRIYLSTTRQLIVMQIQGENLENIGFDNPLQILEARLIAHNLLIIGQEINNLADYTLKHLEELELKTTLTVTIIKTIAKELKELLIEWLDSISKKNLDRLTEIMGAVMSAKNYDEIIENICKTETSEINRIFLRKTLTTFTYALTQAKGIIEASINMFTINPPKTCLIIKTTT